VTFLRGWREPIRIRRPSHGSAAMALLALALIAGACSSSKQSTGTPATTSSAATTGSAGTGGSSTKASGTPYVIGTISDVTGAEASSEGTTNATLQVWVDWVNANGGINGHPVKLIAFDTQFNPANALADAKQLISDHIIALVSDQTSFDSTFESAMQQAGIPVVGGGLFQQSWYTNPDFYPQGTTTLPSLYNEIKLGVNKGMTKMGWFYCAESPACSQSVPLIKGLAQIAGANLAYTASVSASAPNYAAQCLAAQSAGVQFLAIGDNSSTIIRVAQSCAQQNFKPLEVGTDGSVTAEWATSPVMQGALAVQQNAPFSDTANSAIATMIGAIKKYNPSILTAGSWGENDVYSWASGQLFAAAAKAGNLGDNPTAAGVVQGLTSLKAETLGGLAPPLTFASGQNHEIYCEFVQGVSGNKFVQPQGDSLVCAPEATLAPVIAGVVKAVAG
jgi:branched-chain amino acid transport system substrate-binding protein